MLWGNVFLLWCIAVCFCVAVRGEHIGCYEDTSNFYESVGEVRSIGACRSACSTRGNTYYVVKKSGGDIDCHCADKLPGESTDSSGCNKNCGGECGGTHSHSIYSVCDHGHWGWSCNVRCYCEDNDICQKKTGLCPGGCQSGYWGQSCNSLCHCTMPCQQMTGLCDSACSVGFWGGTCSSPCHCFNKEPCNKDNGNCTNGCAAGWTGSICFTECTTGYWGSGCVNLCHCKENAACDRITGHCPQVCAPGWSGVSCDVCATGWSGVSCDVCATGWSGVSCDVCATGWSGVSCDVCATGWSGVSCDVCTTGWSGVSCDVCATGWSGVSCDVCASGYYGDLCGDRCHCKEAARCERATGLCPAGCDPGWLGSDCSTPCDEGSWGDHCSKQCHCVNNNPCDKTNGYCEDGCAAGYMGFSCEDDTCDPGFWGLACNNTCHCKNAADCMRNNGLCPDGCEPGKYGPSCDKKVSYDDIGCYSSEILQDTVPEDIQDSSDKKESCRQMCIRHKSSYFGVVTDSDMNDKCHCIKNSPYNYRQDCTSANLLRKLLAIDSFIIIYTVCPVGSYSTNSIDCNQYCSCPGDSNQSGLCVYDSDSGSEVCEECTGGWQGELCAQDINECHSDDHGCEGDCVNVPGSYHCTCPDGMQLAADYRTCVDITTGPSFCSPGYRYSTDSDRCVDIDECTEDTHGCSHGCVNTQGSFQCLCPDGQVPDSQVSCIDIPQTEQPTPKPNKSLSTTTIAIIAAIVCVLVVLAVIITTVLLVRRRRSKPSHLDNHMKAAPKPSASNIYNNTYDTVGEEKVEGIYNTIPDADDKRPTSDVILMENTNYESQETHAVSDGRIPTSEDIILDNTNYESQDLIYDTQQRENAYHLAKETGENDTNDDINNVSDSQTVVVNGDVYNLPNKPQKIDLKEDGKLSAEDSKIKDVDKSMYSLAKEGVGAGDDNGAYSLAKNPEDPGISGDVYSLAKNSEYNGVSGGAYILAKNPEDLGISGGVYNLPKNPDNCDVREETSIRMNESEKIVNGDIYRLPSKQNKDQPQ